MLQDVLSTSKAFRAWSADGASSGCTSSLALCLEARLCIHLASPFRFHLRRFQCCYTRAGSALPKQLRSHHPSVGTLGFDEERASGPPYLIPTSQPLQNDGRTRGRGLPPWNDGQKLSPWRRWRGWRRHRLRRRAGSLDNGGRPALRVRVELKRRRLQLAGRLV